VAAVLPLANRAVLVAHSDYLVGLQIAHACVTLGARVIGPCPDAETCRDVCGDVHVDAVLVDPRLRGLASPYDLALPARYGIPVFVLAAEDEMPLPRDVTRQVRFLPLAWLPAQLADALGRTA
jgi:hypothetical protein